MSSSSPPPAQWGTPGNRRKRRLARPVLSCRPCYSKKQKCNRQYPCNHCIHRRKPELCTYHVFQSPIQQPNQDASAGVADKATDAGPAAAGAGAGAGAGIAPSPSSSVSTGSQAGDPATLPQTATAEPPLAELFGYSGEHSSNLLGILRKFGVQEEPSQIGTEPVLRAHIAKRVETELDKLPARPIIDFLIQHFLKEANWINQVIYPPVFLGQYRTWWSLSDVTRVADLDFAILILRICAHACQGLSSTSYMLDTTGSISIAQTRDRCCELADSLRDLSAQACPTGSIFRVQHHCLAALKDDIDERMASVFWNLSQAIHTAIAIGMHKEPQMASHADVDELECELRRRLFCNLYSWDIRLARSLGRPPLLSLIGSSTEMPKMNLEAGVDDPAAPELFTERILQARLAKFWTHMDCNAMSTLLTSPGDFEPAQAEENYERFCLGFLPTVPATYALRPDTQFDHRLPMLRKQRQLFHLALFECICINFKALLSLDAAQVAGLPSYKQALLSHQRVRLARAAVALLDSVTTLQTLLGLDVLGTRHSCLSIISYACFEAGALLACLVISASKLDSLEPLEDGTSDNTMFQLPSDPLSRLYSHISKHDHVQAIEKALKSLELLSGVSMMARAGAKRLTNLLQTVRTSMGSITKAANTTDMFGVTANGSGVSTVELGHSGTSTAETNLSGPTYLERDSFDPPPSHHHPGAHPASFSASHPQIMQGTMLQLETLSDMELLAGFPDMTEFLDLGIATPDTGVGVAIDDFQTLAPAWTDNHDAYVRDLMQ